MTSEQNHLDGELNPNRIAVFGLGYVGTVTAGCLAEAGHDVFGVDIVSEKVAAINRGEISFVEPGLDEVVRTAVETGHLRATTDTAEAVTECDISLISVGTPSRANGMPDFQHLYEVCRSIGEVLTNKAGCHDVVIRSTILPGTAQHCAALIEEASGKREGEGFRLLVNPEFLREGTALRDYYDPPFTVVGATSHENAQRVASLYRNISSPLFVVPRNEAETIKYACNLFHAVKVVFANEIGRICRSANVDGGRVMEIFCHDDKLNLSSYYLKPGYAYGGSCLPKDLRAIVEFAREHHINMPMLERVQESNRQQIELGCQLVEAQGKRRVALLGFSFKPTTDDLRESPLVILTEMLVGKGYELRILDRQVVLSNLTGANKGFLQTRLPHAAHLITDDLGDLMDWAECFVLGSQIAEVEQVLEQANADQTIIDLVGAGAATATKANYQALNGPSRMAGSGDSSAVSGENFESTAWLDIDSQAGSAQPSVSLVESPQAGRTT